MLNLISKTTIVQQPNPDFPSRNKSFVFDFVNSGEVISTWQNLTDTARLIFPKNIYFKDETGNNYTWQGKNINGKNDTPPLLMRGDKIKIEWGYNYNVDINYKYERDLNIIFEGYVSKIVNRIPVEIEAEDNMWKLKQIACPSKLFSTKQYTLQTMLEELLQGTGITVNSIASTNAGDIRTGNETVAQLLDRLQRDYRIESYFRGNELRCSGIVYYSDYLEQVFRFQNNIISDQLEYRRLDDVKIGLKAYSVNEEEVMGKKRKKRLSVFVTKDSKGNLIQVPEDGFEGEKRTWYLWNVTTQDQLFKKSGNILNRIYYEGFYGGFKTFGFPFVRHGDHAIIQDNILPERSGTYKIKGVTYSFGMDGYRQDIDIDMRVDGLSKAELQQGL